MSDDKTASRNTTMRKPAIDIGVSFPTTEIGTDPIAMRDFAQAIEDMGYGYMVAYDRLLGVNPVNRPDWKNISPFTHESSFQEPLVLFSYLAGATKKLRLITSVVVLPQRQTLLFAKQAANLDHYCGGRLRLGVSIGQNPTEYDVMGVPYKGRAARLEEQIHLLRRLWTEPWFTDHGEFHDIVEAGLNPLPVQRPIPIWIAAHAPAGLDRVARIGDGLMCSLDVEMAEQTIDAFHERLRHHGRDPNNVRVMNCIRAYRVPGANEAPEKVVDCVETWRKAGLGHVHIHTMDMGLRGADQHIDYLRRLAALLGLRPEGSVK